MALLMVVLSCKGRQNGANAQVADALYATEKAKTVRMYEIPAPLKDRPEQILYRKGYTTSYNQMPTPKVLTSASRRLLLRIWPSRVLVPLIMTILTRVTIVDTCVLQAIISGIGRR